MELNSQINSKTPNKTPNKSSNTNSSIKKSNHKQNTSANKKLQNLKQDNLNNAINRSIVNGANLTDSFHQDNKDISECIYLNKLNNTDVNLADYNNESKIIQNIKLSSEEIKDNTPNK